MNLFYKILRAVIVTIIAIALTIPAILYVGLSLPNVQQSISKKATGELSRLLGADVDIQSLTIAPFNRLMLRDVSVATKETGDTVMTVERLGAGINLYEFIYNREIVINYVEIVGLDLKVKRDSTGAPLNIQPIIDKLAPRDAPKQENDINLAINTVILRNACLTYDVDSIPEPEPGVFSANHIGIYDLSADLRLPSIGNKAQSIEIKRFRLKETSGLEISNIAGSIAISPDSLSWSNLSIEMPQSDIRFIDCSIHGLNSGPILQAISGQHISTGIAEGSRITPADLAPLQPHLADISSPMSLRMSFDGILDSLSNISMEAKLPDNEFRLSLDAELSQLPDSASRAIRDLRISARSTASTLAILPLDKRIREITNAAEYIDLKLDGSMTTDKVSVTSSLSTARGNADITANITGPASKRPGYDIDLNVTQLELGTLLQNNALDIVTLDASASGFVSGKKPDGIAEVNIERFDWHGHRFSDITASIHTHGSEYSLEFDSDDPAAQLKIKASGEIDKQKNSMNLAAAIDFLDIGEIMPGNKYSDYTMCMRIHSDLQGRDIDNTTGRINLHDIRLQRPDGAPIEFNGLLLAATDAPDGERIIDLSSDIIDGEIRGDIFLSTLARQLKELALTSIPALDTTPRTGTKPGKENNFSYAFTLHDTEPWADALRLPVSNLGESSIRGNVDYMTGAMTFDLEAPFLRQGNKLVENTRLLADIDSSTGESGLGFSTFYPTKHGAMHLDFKTRAISDSVASRLRWSIDRAARYDGDISVDATFSNTPDGTHSTVTINPGQLTFNDSTWTVNRATVDITPGRVEVNGINAHRSGQFVKIQGNASYIPDDVISVDLLGVNLDYIFESLGIDKVMLGGDATGCFYASNLLSREPRLTTPGLFVKSISYNKVVLGDALVKSNWDFDRRAITLDAVVDQPNGKQTLIDGAIFPLNDSLDITFDANDVNVSFMHPYMSAFAGEVSGQASGRARLWGNFKYIDMEGDIAADNVRIKVAFTNTSYTTSDTIRLRLGEISLNDMEISDTHGNKARLNGKVWHKYFKEPVFDFNITDARNMLVYDETSRQNPDWYGSIYGNGSAHISGEPGIVNINVDMSTAPGSVFTFVLNDMEEASDYTFITFRDRDILAMGEREELVDNTPGTVRRLREMLAKREEGSSSAYNIDLMMDINTNAQINLIMDPVGGDRIRTWGNGNMRMSYASNDNELHMYGSYTLEHGGYNFTLQDIIIKDFTIKPGSTISFTGDPFSAMLDIKAAYPLTANLSDLDESFLQDKDLNRTTVPVNAILQVTGAMQQPDISFDLEFPTLTQDTYRKVRSIVSTEDMMNRQIIYLLALGRFYTPDYMSTANRGNELVSVASSTISSQLGNILGSLSDKWNIAPTFRSDRGDFSDMEVDVALSSSLLNNRLLFNGNFGYRDKTLNNTQFVGDFDIEYLLNRAGTLRLKAYNRYNDMNYYVRTAETTQGVGISFRRNFDNFTELIRRHIRQEHRTDTISSHR